MRHQWQRWWMCWWLLRKLAHGHSHTSLPPFLPSLPSSLPLPTRSVTPPREMVFDTSHVDFGSRLRALPRCSALDWRIKVWKHNGRACHLSCKLGFYTKVLPALSDERADCLEPPPTTPTLCHYVQTQILWVRWAAVLLLWALVDILFHLSAVVARIAGVSLASYCIANKPHTDKATFCKCFFRLPENQLICWQRYSLKEGAQQYPGVHL